MIAFNDDDKSFITFCIDFIEDEFILDFVNNTVTDWELANYVPALAELVTLKRNKFNYKYNKDILRNILAAIFAVVDSADSITKIQLRPQVTRILEQASGIVDDSSIEIIEALFV